MDSNQLRAVGSSLAARHARNKARLERDADRSATHYAIGVTTALAVIVAALMMML